MLLAKCQCIIKIAKAACVRRTYGKATRIQMEGRDMQNARKSLDVFYSMWFISAFKFACFELCNVRTGLFEQFLSNIR